MRTNHSTGPANVHGIYLHCLSESEVNNERAGPGVALPTIDFVHACFPVEVNLDARSYGRTIGGCSFQFKSDEVARFILILQNLKPWL